MSDFKKWLSLILGVVCIWLVSLLSPVLVPFFIAAFLAYIGDPCVERLNRAGCPRALGVVFLFVIFIGIVAALLVWVIPKVQEQLDMLVNTIPILTEWVQKTFAQLINGHPHIKELVSQEQLQEKVSSQAGHLGNIVSWVVKAITHSSIAIINFVIQLALIPVVTFYLMRDWPKLTQGLRRLIPRAQEATVISLATEVDTVLAAFLKGQLFVMIVLAIIYSIGLSLIGLNFALILGVMIGILSVIPYLGSIVGIILALSIAAFQFNSIWPFVWVLLVFGIGHILEGMVLTPWLIGDRIGLHPVAVIFSVLAGGVLFGFFGVLLALPVAAVIMVFVRHYRDRYLASRLYS